MSEHYDASTVNEMVVPPVGVASVGPPQRVLVISTTMETSTLPDTTIELTTAALQLEKTTASVVVECVTLCIMWLLGIFGNILVCLVIHRSRRLQSTTNSFVVSLACTDLLMSFTVMPLTLVETATGRWDMGSALCKLMRFVQWIVPAASMFVLTCICIDRFYSIIYPLSFKITRGRAKRMILGGWLLCIVMSAPVLYLTDVEYEEATMAPQCRTYMTVGVDAGTVFYVILFTLLMYFTPILVEIGGYLRIFKYIWRAGVGGRTFQRTMNPVPRAKVKMVKMMMVVTFTTAILLAPYYIIQMWHCSVDTTISEENAKSASLYTAALWMCFATTMSKPGAYMCFNSNFRRGCKEVFCMSTMKCYRSHAYTITTASKLGKKNHIGVISDPNLSNHSDYQRVDPARHFEHAIVMEKPSWPATNNMPSTYL